MTCLWSLSRLVVRPGRGPRPLAPTSALLPDWLRVHWTMVSVWFSVLKAETNISSHSHVQPQGQLTEEGRGVGPGEASLCFLLGEPRDPRGQRESGGLLRLVPHPQACSICCPQPCPEVWAAGLCRVTTRGSSLISRAAKGKEEV